MPRFDIVSFSITEVASDKLSDFIKLWRGEVENLTSLYWSDSSVALAWILTHITSHFIHGLHNETDCTWWDTRLKHTLVSNLAVFLLTYSRIPAVCCENTTSGEVCTATWACQKCQKLADINHPSQDHEVIFNVCSSESRCSTQNQREESTYVEVSKNTWQQACISEPL